VNNNKIFIIFNIFLSLIINCITIKLIMHCVSSSSYSILWNGNKLPTFKPSHGLRQGDPLSPNLFILCMEKLSDAINSAVNQGGWNRFKSQTGVRKYLTSSLQMMSSSSPKRKALSFISFTTSLKNSVEHRVWKLISPSQEPTTLQVFLKVKSLTSPLFPEFKAQPLLESTWVSLCLKADQRKVTSTSSLKKCKLAWHLGRIDS